MDDPLKNMHELNPSYTATPAAESSSYSSFFLLIIIIAAALMYKFRKKISGEEEDGFLKPQRSSYESFSNPFDRPYNRRGRDNDNDDYDRHVWLSFKTN